MKSVDVGTSALLKLAAFALGFTILAGGVWSALLVVNLRTTPAIPWSVPLMATLLWLAWRQLGRTPVRRARLRALKVPKPVFTWALIAGLLSIAALSGLWIVLAQLVHVKGNALPDFSHYSAVVVVLVIVMASVTSAAAEEVGIRGYLQSALEMRFSGLVAILLGTLVILPAHALTQGFALTTIVFYVCVDVMLGLTAYLTQSIVPGFVVHVIGLIVFFSMIWPFDAGRRFVGTSGPDTLFWIHVAQTLACGVMAVLAFRHLARLSGPQRPAGAARKI